MTQVPVGAAGVAGKGVAEGGGPAGGAGGGEGGDGGPARVGDRDLAVGGGEAACLDRELSSLVGADAGGAGRGAGDDEDPGRGVASLHAELSPVQLTFGDGDGGCAVGHGELAADRTEGGRGDEGGSDHAGDVHGDLQGVGPLPLCGSGVGFRDVTHANFVNRTTASGPSCYDHWAGARDALSARLWVPVSDAPWTGDRRAVVAASGPCHAWESGLVQTSWALSRVCVTPCFHGGTCPTD